MVKPDLEVESIDELGVAGLEKAGTEVEYLDDFTIEGEPMPVKEENEYNEVVEERRGGSTSTTENITTIVNETNIINRRNLDNMGRHVIKETSSSTTTNRGYGNLDNMSRHVIKETSSSTTTKYGGNKGGYLDNMGRSVIKETSTTETITRRGGSGYGSGLVSSSGYGSGNGNMTRKVIVESSTTTKSGSSGLRGVDGSSFAYKGASRTTKTTGGKKAWDLEIGNGDEVFTGRHPSDEEVSTGGNGYSKYSSKREVRYQPASKGATTKVSKYSVTRTSKGY